MGTYPVQHEGLPYVWAVCPDTFLTVRRRCICQNLQNKGKDKKGPGRSISLDVLILASRGIWASGFKTSMKAPALHSLEPELHFCSSPWQRVDVSVCFSESVEEENS